MIESANIDILPLPARSPNLNAHAQRWVRSVKAECLSKTIPFGERPHQGKNNKLLFRQITETRRDRCDVAIGWVDFYGTIIEPRRE